MRVGVVGAGIMGQMVALECAKAGFRVSVFEKGCGADNCSQVAAGLLTPYSELDRGSELIFRLGLQAITSLWPAILEQMPTKIYYQKTGTMVVHHPQDKAEWEHFSKRINKRLQQNDFAVNALSQQHIQSLEPTLNRFEHAYYFPDEAHIDSQAFLACLQTHLLCLGVHYHFHTEIVNLEALDFDLVIDCRGLHAKNQFSDLRGLRGELMHVHAPDITLTRPVRFLHPRYSIYVVPRPGNTYIIGASEIEAEDFSPISVRTSLELLTALYYVNPAFAEARIIKSVTHCRPTLKNHEPQIKRKNSVIAINGLYRHGYLIAPALAAELMQAIKSDFQNLSYPEIWEHNHAEYLSQ